MKADLFIQLGGSLVDWFVENNAGWNRGGLTVESGET
jgi:hypothetical protein